MRRFILTVALLFNVFFVVSVFAEGIDWGFTMRLRNEYLGDVYDLNNASAQNENYYRIKSSLWGKYNIQENMNVYIKLSNEGRYYNESNFAINKSDIYDNDDLLIENLYFEANNLIEDKLDVKVGRQDLFYGEGFVIMDGTPEDDSRTTYFNAIKAVYHINERSWIDFVYTSNPREDKLVLFNDSNRGTKPLTTSGESALIIYGVSKMTDKFTFQPYIIMKKEGPATQIIPGAPIDAELSLNTIGLRSEYSQDPFKARMELATQSGSYNDALKTKRSGLGYLIGASYIFKSAVYKPEVETAIISLSGDDTTTTGTVEAWNPLFSRGEWLAVLPVYTYFKETGISGYITNINWTKLLGIKLKMTDDIDLCGSYNLLSANQVTALASEPRGPEFSNKGTARGTLLSVYLAQRFSDTVTVYMLADQLTPGNFYGDTTRDVATFFRLNIDLKFK